MGSHEAAAWTSATELLELAIASGDLTPGTRGWKARQQELVRAPLDAPREELPGQSLAAVIISERAEAWVSRWRSPTRQQIAASAANRLLGLLRREVEALARATHGDRSVNKQQARAELTRVNREIRRLRTELAELEERRAKLSCDLGE